LFGSTAQSGSGNNLPVRPMVEPPAIRNEVRGGSRCAARTTRAATCRVPKETPVGDTGVRETGDRGIGGYPIALMNRTAGNGYQFQISRSPRPVGLLDEADRSSTRPRTERRAAFSTLALPGSGIRRTSER